MLLRDGIQVLWGRGRREVVSTNYLMVNGRGSRDRLLVRGMDGAIVRPTIPWLSKVAVKGN